MDDAADSPTRVCSCAGLQAIATSLVIVTIRSPAGLAAHAAAASVDYGVIAGAARLPAYRLTQGRRPGADTAPAVGPSSARQILDERYVRGEINDEEYRERRDELT